MISAEAKTKIRAAIWEIYDKYKFRDKMSYTKLMQMLYLADWKMAIEYGRQITEISWCISPDEYTNFMSVYEPEDKLRAFVCPNSVTYQVQGKDLEDYYDVLSNEELVTIAHVVGVAENYTNPQFSRLVQSTYPFFGNKWDIDLVQAAEEYKAHSEI